MWNCGDSGIQAAADAIIRNNIILESPDNGFNSQPHQDVSPNNLDFIHNTVIGGNPCIRINGWSNKQGLVFANNAIYCASDSFSVGGVDGVAVSGNVFEPATGSFPANGYTEGRSETADFLDAAGRDLYPTSDSVLLGAGNPTYATSIDFNGTQRLGSVDAGAYAWTGAQNPGWPIAPGFKDANPAPTLSIAASPVTVDYQGQSTLSWSTTNTLSCEASGAWSGTKPTNGQQVVGPLTVTSNYGLACENPDGVSVSQSATVTVRPTPAISPTLALSADAASVGMNGSTMLSWTSTDAKSCLASDAWAGDKPPSGSEPTGPLSGGATYTLDCTGPGGIISRSVTIQVQSAVTGTPEQPGSGALVWFNLVLLLGVGIRAVRATRSVSTIRIA